MIRFKGIEIVTEERLVMKDGSPVDLTPKEFDLLMTMYGHREKIYTRSELLDLVWGYDFMGIRGRWIRIFRGSAKIGCRRSDHNRIRHRV